MRKRYTKKKLYEKEDAITKSVESMARFLKRNGMRQDRIEDVIWCAVEDSIDRLVLKIDNKEKFK